MNKLWFGDNLTILREEIADESVDLVYLDPPFNSNANYNVLFRTPSDEAAGAQVEAFRDTWTWGNEAQWALDEIMRTGGLAANIVRALHSAMGESDMMAYLVMMAQRLKELRRVLRVNGSLYLHCDPTASHYLKIIMDGIFGHRNFRNEIVWKRTGSHGGSKRWGPVHDVILFYSMSDKYTWNRTFQDYDTSYLDDFYRFEDENGRYRLVTLTGAGVRTGDSGKPWKGVNPTVSGRHWAIPLGSLRRAYPELDISDLSTQEKLDLLDKAKLIYWPTRGTVPQQKRYSDEAPGVPIQSIVTDIKPISSHASERLGYPTQKPQALLDRIIRSSSNPGETVLHPFCGCGTTVASAHANDRQWIGIDVAFHAIKVIEDRLRAASSAPTYDLGGIPRDYEGAARLAERDKFQFQWWANYLVGVQALKETKKGRDRGIDGEMFFMNGPHGWGRILTSVKGGQNVGVRDVRELRSVLDREAAEMGLFICLRRPTRDMASEAASFGFAKTAHGHLPRLQIVSIEEWFQGARPSLPSLGHVTREFFEPAKRTKVRKRNPNAPEFTFTFPGSKKDDVVIHLNPAAVISAKDAASS